MARSLKIDAENMWVRTSQTGQVLALSHLADFDRHYSGSCGI
jgi:hypothetical protein